MSKSEKIEKIYAIILYAFFRLKYSWFTINPPGCGRQCQPLTPARSDNGTCNIFVCVVPTF